MKKIIILHSLLVACLFSSCNFLNVDDYFEDTFQADKLFDSKYNIERYFNGAAALIPNEANIWVYSDLPGITATDEVLAPASFTPWLVIQYSGTFLTLDRISFSETGGFNWNFYQWENCYRIIRKVNTILPRIEEVPDMNSFEKSDLRGQARFLRAYAYYFMLLNQGPMIILGDDVLETNEMPEYYALERNTYDECIDYICSEFEAAAENLERTNPTDLWERPTKGAAYALVARLRLMAASPLFNGGAPARKYFGNFKRSSDGVYYISQEYDERKWAVAAAACKRVMDMGLYRIHTVDADDFTLPLPSTVPSAAFPNGAGGIDPYRSYSEMFNGETLKQVNPEFIWSTENGADEHLPSSFPFGLGGFNTLSVPQRMVDSYYMADGRDISDPSPEYPYENRPYDTSCQTQSDQYLSKDYVLKAGTYKAFVNREPRFYANIAFSGSYWPLESTTDSNLKNKVVHYYYGSPYGRNNMQYGVYNMTGYAPKKSIHPRDALTGSGSKTIKKSFPIIRYAEILLSYAEALNNLTESHEIDGETYSRDEQEIAEAFNQIRFRAGLPGVTTQELSSVAAFNELIQRERLLEFMFENRRYYDVRRWGIVEDLEREPLTGLNIDMTEWNGFYAPTIVSHASVRERVFKSKMMLLPIHRDELRKVPTLDQNPGWEQ